MTDEEAKIKNATVRMLERFNSIPQDIVKKLIESGDDVIEVTPDSKYKFDSGLPNKVKGIPETKRFLIYPK